MDLNVLAPEAMDTVEQTGHPPQWEMEAGEFQKAQKPASLMYTVLKRKRS